MEVLAFSACLDPSIIDYPKVGKNEQYKISRTGSSDHLVEQYDLCTFRVLNSKATGNSMYNYIRVSKEACVGLGEGKKSLENTFPKENKY